MTILNVFIELSSSDTPVHRDVTRRREGDEEVIVVALEGARCVGNATLWERPHVGGLIDFTVIGIDGVQALFRHLEGPTDHTESHLARDD